MQEGEGPVVPRAEGPILSRRQFLQLFGSLAVGGVAAASLPPNVWAEPALLTETLMAGLEPHPDATLTNLSSVPSELFTHRDTEPLSLALNFGHTYSRDTTNHLLLGPEEGTLSPFWQGVKEAIGRGQQVHLVIELPGRDHQDVGLVEWATYVAAITQHFTGAVFIIGNELNANLPDAKALWANQPDRYADYYLAAEAEIRQGQTPSIVLPYGEAYYKDGAILTRVLQAIAAKCQTQGKTLSDVVDGLAFHFYDKAQHLPQRTNLYQHVAQRFGLDPHALYLTELGKPEKLVLSEKDQAIAVQQNLATALALCSTGSLRSCIWHTAFALDDPGGHGLTDVNKLGQIDRLKQGFIDFWTITKAFHHTVSFSQPIKGISMVTGKSSDNRWWTLVWNSQTNPAGNPIIFEVPGTNGEVVELPPSTQRGVEGQPRLFLLQRDPNEPTPPKKLKHPPPKKQKREKGPLISIFRR